MAIQENTECWQGQVTIFSGLVLNIHPPPAQRGQVYSTYCWHLAGRGSLRLLRDLRATRWAGKFGGKRESGSKYAILFSKTGLAK
jgi:hypothetical protein